MEGHTCALTSAPIDQDMSTGVQQKYAEGDAVTGGSSSAGETAKQPGRANKRRKMNLPKTGKEAYRRRLSLVTHGNPDQDFSAGREDAKLGREKSRNSFVDEENSAMSGSPRAAEMQPRSGCYTEMNALFEGQQHTEVIVQCTTCALRDVFAAR